MKPSLVTDCVILTSDEHAGGSKAGPSSSNYN